MNLSVRILGIILLALNIVACTDSKEAAEQTESEEGLGNMALVRNYDEVFSFELLPATGPGSIAESGNTVTLLMNIPYLLSSGLIPPEFVVNELLSRGLNDAGMSGGAQWAPYRLKQGDFDALVDALKEASTLGDLEYREPDAWVKNFEDWHVWVMYEKHGVPWEEHKRLNDVTVAIEQAMRIAEQGNDEARLNELHLEYIKAGADLSEFTMKYLNH